MEKIILEKFILISILLIQTGVIHASRAQVTGPFTHTSFKSPNFKKPPFKTGARSCQILFSGVFPPKASLNEIRSKWPVMAREIKQKIFEAISAQTPYKTRSENLKRSLLSCSVCVGGTTFLIQALDKANIHLDVVPVITTSRIDAIEAQHVYLVSENYFGPGEHLILDPTIRQFFSKRLADRSQKLSQKEINEKIPMIFLGTTAELKTLFQENFKPTEADPDQDWQTVVDLYLDTHIWSNILDNGL